MDTQSTAGAGTPVPARRGALSRDVVVAAAVAMVDRDGIEAVTMRKLAVGSVVFGAAALTACVPTSPRAALMRALGRLLDGYAPVFDT